MNQGKKYAPVKQNVTRYSYADAFFAPDHIVCAAKMRPLCLGHLMLLEKMHSPVIQPLIQTDILPEVEIEQFYEAILVCAMSFEDGLNFLTDKKEYKKQCKLFSKNMEKYLRKSKDFSLKFERNKFNNYLSYYLNSMPHYDVLHESKELPSGLDWKIGMLEMFSNKYTESAILNMNLKKAFYEWCGYLESKGGIRVYNKYDVPAKIEVLNN